jgi:hypothetical protein
MNCFVFVVCGSEEHVSTLNLSLRFLRKFSSFPILVITDTTRNEVPVKHDNIIDIKTPENFDHHEASIYLKTGLHKFVPNIENDTYCYLDSDVIAISALCNNVFDHTPNPILFAKDHCPFSVFSPDAIHCTCKQDQLIKNEHFYSAVNEVFPLANQFDNKIKNVDKMHLDEIFTRFKQRKLKHLGLILWYFLRRYILPTKSLQLGSYTLNKLNKCWYNSKGEIIDFEFPYYEKKLQKKFNISFNTSTNNWIDKDGNFITPQIPNCNHLAEHIKNKFEISIPQNWRHWNGGVFIFNKNSIEFMDFWHKITLEEFNDPATKTRDQGTLAVSAWKFGLQDKPTLPIKYNFITEYSNTNIQWKKDKGYTLDGFTSITEPSMLHIYHHWGDTNWDIWNSVVDLKQKLNL